MEQYPGSFASAHEEMMLHIPHGAVTPSRSKRFACTVAGCEKLFNRKEHLTRHMKSHNPQPQYQCPLCGRRYARSDVLKRHVEFHPRYTSPGHVPSTKSSMQSSPEEDRGEIESITNEDRHVYPGQSSDAGRTLVEASWGGFQQEWAPPQSPWSLPPNFQLGAEPPLPNGLNGAMNWMVSPGGQNSNELGLHVPEDHHSQLPQVGGGQSDDSSVISQTDPDMSESTGLSSLTSQTPASHTTPPDDPGTGLHVYLSRDFQDVNRLIRVYFARVHPWWPLLHAPTFEPKNASETLLGAIAMLASLVEGGAEHLKLMSPVLVAITGKHLDTDTSLHTLQALILCVIYATCRLTEEGMAATALRLNTTLVSTCRYIGLFHDEHVYHHDLEDSPFSIWLAQEHLHRLAFSVLRADAYLSIILDHPPSIRYQELCITLPKSERLWTASDDDERRGLQWDEPAGRQKALFSFLLRDVLSGGDGGRQMPYRLTKDDFHLSICALQGGVWEAAREAHSSATGELDLKLSPGDPIQTWRSHLNCWRASMERDTALRRDYFSGPHSGPSNGRGMDRDILSPLTLLLWHMSSLKMHAPLSLLQSSNRQYHARGRGSRAVMPMRSPEVRLRTWMQSSCPRIATWNAAQIMRVVMRERERVGDPGAASGAAPDAVLNPLVVPGIHMSAVVACSYAHHTRACASCTGGSLPADVVDLWEADDGDAGLVGWREEGRGQALWGPSGIVLCRCRLADLAAWFCAALGSDEGSKTEFVTFFRALEKS